MLHRFVVKFAYSCAITMQLAASVSYAAGMTTTGQFSVSQSGAATYSVPIQVPPGTAGMEPKLALAYNSQGGNGLLGIGWDLSGLSAIARCPQTMAQDGVKSAINYDNNDRFCLDGQRLMVINGSYGNNGAEYRTEREGFARIVSYGVAGNGPAYFKVWTKSGQIIEYGSTSDSRIEAQGKDTVAVWSINKVSDTKGNYMSMTYTEDNANGAYYLNRIDYAGNSNTGAAPTRTSAFEYDAATGLLTKEIIEPDNAQLRIETTYTYDSYGNKIAATVSSPASGSAAIDSRTSTSTFDARGEFPISDTNALNQTETKVIDSRFGVVTSLTGPNGLTTQWQYDSFGRKVLEVRADGNRVQWQYLYCNGTNGGTVCL